METMNLNKKQIDAINAKCPGNQGIFVEPYGCDGIIKPVVYMRWEKGGLRGGSCWNDSDAQPFINNEPKPRFKALELVVKEFRPNISFFDFREIEDMIVTVSETTREYYGNETNYGIEYIKLEDLCAKLEELQ